MGKYLYVAYILVRESETRHSKRKRHSVNPRRSSQCLCCGTYKLKFKAVDRWNENNGAEPSVLMEAAESINKV
jgi:hypothetical protein